MRVDRESPNHLRDAKASNMRPTSGAAYGSALDLGAGERVGVKTSRVLRVQIEDLSHFEWLDLLLLARESAQFCNANMADFYARELGYSTPGGDSVFVRAKGRLSGDARVALGREAFTQWRMHKAKILSGQDRLAFFTERRSLVCRAEHMSKGKRQRHSWIYEQEGKHYLTARLVGKDGERVIGEEKNDSGKTKLVWGKKGERHVFRLWWKPQVDERNAPVMDGLAAGVIRLLKITFQFQRPGKKVFALLTYEKHVEPAAPGSAEATLGPLEADGSLWLRVKSGPPHNYTAWIHELISKKEHFEGIRDRLRGRTKRSGPGNKQDYRRALVKAGNFTTWARGRIHQMSADIVSKLTAANVGLVTINPIALGELPMHMLEEMLKYKLADAGIEIVRIDPTDATTGRAFERVLSKREASTRKAKKALRVVREAIEAGG